MAYKDPLDPRAREARRKHYRANREQYYERNRLKQAQLRQYVLELKNDSPCLDCGESFPGEPWLLEFDHARGEKKRNISQLFTSGSWSALLDEIEKCDLVCVLCHRRRTADRGGWLDNRLAHLLQ